MIFLCVCFVIENILQIGNLFYKIYFDYFEYKYSCFVGLKIIQVIQIEL